LLHASKEARREGLKYYTICLEKSLFEEGCESTTYISFSVDRFRHQRIEGLYSRDLHEYKHQSRSPETHSVSRLRPQLPHSDEFPISGVWVKLISHITALEDLTVSMDGWGRYRNEREKALGPVSLDLLRRKIELGGLENILSDSNWEISCPIKFKFMLLQDDVDTAAWLVDQQPNRYFGDLIFFLGGGPFEIKEIFYRC
jgi:hypothetical protein